MTTDLQSTYLRDLVRTYYKHKLLAERAMAQVSDGDLHRLIDDGANSIAVVVKHVAGNLRLRFSDFLTADGEKPGRNRDREFEPDAEASRQALMAAWNEGWAVALASIEALAPADLDRTIHIRGEAFAVIEALNRSVAHTAYHVGQIVLLAKHFAGADWTSLSIPKGRSAGYAHGTFKQDIVPRS